MVAKTQNIVALPMNNEVHSSLAKYNGCKNRFELAKVELVEAKVELKDLTDSYPSNQRCVMGDYEFNRVEASNPATVDWKRLEKFLNEHGKSKKDFLNPPKSEFKEPTFDVKYIGKVEA